MESIFQLIYMSTAVEPMQEDSLQKILEKAYEKNERLEITGALVYNSGHFLQLLEGDQDKVLKLYLQIAGDRRHENVVTLFQGTTHKRLFGHWTMAYKKTTEFDLKMREQIEQTIFRISNSQVLENPQQVIRVMRDLQFHF
ncbi:MAG: BLUF domain-containing protein [Pseudomonadota bacterium]